ncbi:MAG UNVERIFIED_CONTAM: hypothetical protein LVQ98_03655 [Rickettsiaceae bacterium]|jgi:hypothetical protein
MTQKSKLNDQATIQLMAGKHYFTAGNQTEAANSFLQAKDLFTRALGEPLGSDDPKLQNVIKQNIGTCYKNLGATYIEGAKTDPANRETLLNNAIASLEEGKAAGYTVEPNLDIANHNLGVHYAEKLVEHCNDILANPLDMTTIDAAITYIQTLDPAVLQANQQNSNFNGLA